MVQQMIDISANADISFNSKLKNKHLPNVASCFKPIPIPKRRKNDVFITTSDFSYDDDLYVSPEIFNGEDNKNKYDHLISIPKLSKRGYIVLIETMNKWHVSNFVSPLLNRVRNKEYMDYFAKYKDLDLTYCVNVDHLIKKFEFNYCSKD
ncbi:hypothetical protein A3Q56_00064 [Intoshia linei]|uniref:Uncharacterized protein n=1 Tax=Intoshia linei TaxID=1819745 RepID=A0A177BFC0_9BILA|nr:hypothetical protein A3Q56_00064 [Intoshia linei]